MFRFLLVFFFCIQLYFLSFFFLGIFFLLPLVCECLSRAGTGFVATSKRVLSRFEVGGLSIGRNIQLNLMVSYLT